LTKRPPSKINVMWPPTMQKAHNIGYPPGLGPTGAGSVRAGTLGLGSHLPQAKGRT
jgi:hypothetical protein